MSAAYYPQVQKIYVAYYGRPADPAGLQYWAGQLAANGGSLTAIINAFGNSAESTALYAGADNAAKVTAIYQQLFNRSPDSAGLAFYVNELSLGRMTAASIALNVANGATGTDATYLTNKQSVASSFTDSLTTDSAAAVAYAGTTAANTARALISGVTTSAATTNVASTIAAIKPGGGAAATGQTFTLTTSPSETVVGTSKNDAVTALFTTSATTNAVQASDSVTDSSTTDNDTLTFDLAGDLFSDVTTSAAPTVRNIENLVFNVNTSSANLATDVTYDNAATRLFVDGTTMTGVKNYAFNLAKAQSGVSGVSLLSATADSTVTVDSKLSSLIVGTRAAGDAINIKMNNAGVPGTPATATVANAAGDVTASGSGDFSLTATTATGAVTATGGKNLTVSAAGAGVVMASTTGGTATVTATAATLIDVSASSDVTLTNSGAGSVKITSGGSITTAGAQNATSMTLTAAGASTLGAANAVTSLTLSGNGAAATFNRGSNTALANIQVSGDKNVTLTGGGDTLPATVTVTDTGTGTFTLRLNGAATAHDFSGGLIDVLRFDTDQGGVITTVKDTQAITYTLDQGALSVTGRPSATATSNAVTLILNDQVRNAAAVDFTGLTLTDIKTATIDASADVTASGTANTFSLAGIVGTSRNADVTINGGINNLTIGTGNDLGTGSLTVNTSGAITLGASTLTATRFDASKSSGAVTGTGLSNATTREIYTGSAADTLTLNGVGNADVRTGAGNDVLTLDNDSYSGNLVSIDLGDGTDTLVMQSGTKLITGTAGSVSLSGVEGIRILQNGVTGTDQISASVLSGKTYNITASAAGAAGALDVVVLATDTVVDLSTLNGSTAADTTIEGMTFITNAGSNTSKVSIKGMTKAINTITGSSVADALVGGDLNDSFVYLTDSVLFNAAGAAIDTITGGAGNADVLTVGGTTGTAFTIVNTDVFTGITGVERIVSAANAAGVNIALDVTAETAGINRVDTSAAITVAGSINVSEYVSTGVTLTGSNTMADTITGGGGADTITGGTTDAAIDILDGGAGDDTFIYAELADLFAGNADSVDSITGGTGNDTIRLSAATAGFTIAATDTWGRVTGVERITTIATTAGSVSVTLAAGAETAGIDTVNLSAAAAGTNVINVSAFSAARGTTLVGGATVTTNITGGAGNDTITGGTAAETIDGGLGNDVISGGGGADSMLGGGGDDSITGSSGADYIRIGTTGSAAGLAGNATVNGAAGNDTVVFAANATAAATITGGAGDDSITLLLTHTGNVELVFGASASANGYDTIGGFQDTGITGGGRHQLNFSAFLGAGYRIAGNNGIDTTVDKVLNSGTADVNIANQLVVVDATAAGAGGQPGGAALTTANILSLISGTGNALSMSAGKAVILADNNTNTQIFFIDAALDGASGVSVSDIQLVGILNSATADTWTTAMFTG